jgi:hypothetical protein
MWHEYNRQHFNPKAIIFCMINDNPARLSLTGHVKGKTGCVVCVDQTKSIYLPSFSKLVYMRHHILLPRKHKYHQWRTRFNGMIEIEEASKHRDGKFVFEMIKNINVVFGKPMKGKRVRKMKRLQRTLHLRNNQFSSDTYPIEKSLRLVMPSIPCMLQRVSLKVP